MKDGSPDLAPGLRRRNLIAAAATLNAVVAGPATAQARPPSGAATSGTAADPLFVEAVTPAVRHVTYSLPPVNLVTPLTVARLHSVIADLERDEAVRVVIFKSANEHFFFNHFDLRQAKDFPHLDGPSSRAVWVDMVLRLSKAPFVSIARIRGRTRGGGNEFALACDLRYASLERAFFSQPEVGTGIPPGGGGSERLPRLVGRDRALEAILGSEDYDAATAERFGWVTRALPDKDLDAYVDRFAARLASFDKPVLAAAKAQINRATLPPDSEIDTAYAEYTRSLTGPGFAPRMQRLGRLVGENGIDVEMRLGDYLGRIGP